MKCQIENFRNSNIRPESFVYKSEAFLGSRVNREKSANLVSLVSSPIQVRKEIQKTFESLHHSIFPCWTKLNLTK